MNPIAFVSMWPRTNSETWGICTIYKDGRERNDVAPSAELETYVADLAREMVATKGA